MGKQILSLIPAGMENAISSKELAKKCGFESVRSLQSAIHHLRANGELICSTCFDGGGYYLPTCAAEVRAFKKTLQNRAQNTLIAIESAEKYLESNEQEC